MCSDTAVAVRWQYPGPAAMPVKQPQQLLPCIYLCSCVSILPVATGPDTQPLNCVMPLPAACLQTALATGDAATNKWAPPPHWAREFKDEWKFR